MISSSSSVFRTLWTLIPAKSGPDDALWKFCFICLNRASMPSTRSITIGNGEQESRFIIKQLSGGIDEGLTVVDVLLRYFARALKGGARLIFIEPILPIVHVADCRIDNPPRNFHLLHNALADPICSAHSRTLTKSPSAAASA
jgi:hypothetical protein